MIGNKPSEFHPTSTTLGTVLSIILTVVFTMQGCSTSNKPETNTHALSKTDPYCYNGGRSNNYSCDPKLASPQPAMHSPDIDEYWMYETLYEIRIWLHELKDKLLHKN